MRKGWAVKYLKELASIMYGHTAKAGMDEEGPKYLRITDIQNDNVNWDSVPHCKPLGYEIEKYKLKKNDIVFARTGATTGKSFLIENNHNAVFASYLIRVQIKDRNLYSKFLFYFFKSPIYWNRIQKGISGSTQGGFNAKKLGNLQIPIPPLPEQKQIVAILDQAFEAIDRAKANIEKNIQNARELFQSKLDEMFAQKGDNWEGAKLRKICQTTSNIKWDEVDDYYYEYIDLSSVSRDSFNITYTKTISAQNAPSRAKKLIKENDVLFATTRPTLKRVTIVPHKYSNQICSTGFAVLRCIENQVKPKWIFYFLQSSEFMEKIEASQRGASYPAVTDKDVKDNSIVFPKSLDVQEHLTLKLDNIRIKTEHLISQYIAKTKSLEELKKSLLQKAFEGELTQKDAEEISSAGLAAEPEAAYETKK
ncbi:MAG: restriction endonuclease subunit S [Bacteroidales bacterium]|nr:restriction endonuclease subunit S [Bacteroidales bacterium]MCF8333802.1 restriction endonuclease subunit S [Bacteroidales bacterium]